MARRNDGHVSRKWRRKLQRDFRYGGFYSARPAMGQSDLEIAKRLGGKCVNRIGQTTLGELIDELSACDLLLTNDTGTMHLAALLRVPTISIFGSTRTASHRPARPGPSHFSAITSSAAPVFYVNVLSISAACTRSRARKSLALFKT
jgi:hypothetical protein